MQLFANLVVKFVVKVKAVTEQHQFVVTLGFLALLVIEYCHDAGETTSDEGERNDADEHHEDYENALLCVRRVYVTVANCRDCLHDEVECKKVHSDLAFCCLDVDVFAIVSKGCKLVRQPVVFIVELGHCKPE